MKRPASKASVPQADRSRLNRDQLLVDLTVQEQGFFWTRFAAFSAMHAALLVLLAVENPHGLEDGYVDSLLTLVGFVLSIAWVYIQIISLWYVTRYKAAFRILLREYDLLYRPPKYLPLSSTQVGAAVAVCVCGLWSILIATMIF